MDIKCPNYVGIEEFECHSMTNTSPNFFNLLHKNSKTIKELSLSHCELSPLELNLIFTILKDNLNCLWIVQLTIKTSVFGSSNFVLGLPRITMPKLSLISFDFKDYKIYKQIFAMISSKEDNSLVSSTNINSVMDTILNDYFAYDHKLLPTFRIFVRKLKMPF